MSTLYNWFTGQLVTQQDMRTSDLAMQKGEQDLCADTGLFGVVSGFTVGPVSPPSRVVSITAGLGYTPLGMKVIMAGPNVTLDTTFDMDGDGTPVQTPGRSRVISVYVIPDRIGSELRLDAASNPILYRQAESYKFVCMAGTEVVGIPPPPPLLQTGILLADITIDFGQTAYDASCFSVARRQDSLRLAGAPFGTSAGGTGGVYGTHRAGFQAIVDRFNKLVLGTGDTIAGASITYAGSGTWVNGLTGVGAGSVESGIDGVVAALASTTTGLSGADRIGVAADATTPTIAASSLTARLAAVRGANNLIHFNGPPWINGSTNLTATVQEAIDAIIVDLSSITSSGRGTGGQKIGMRNNIGFFSASTVDGYFVQLTQNAGFGGDGASKIGAWPGNAPLFFTEPTVRGQLDELAVKKAGKEYVNVFTEANTFNGPVVCGATLAVTGITTHTGAVSCAASLSVGTTLTCAGAATFNGSGASKTIIAQEAVAVSAIDSLTTRIVVVTETIDLGSTAELTAPVGSNVAILGRSQRRPRVPVSDLASVTIDTSMGDVFVLPNTPVAASPNVIVLRSTTFPLPRNDEQITLFIPAFATSTGGPAYLVEREDGTSVCTLNNVGLSIKTTLTVSFVYTGGVWRLGPNSGLGFYWDGTSNVDVGVVPLVGA